jgi:hypothetical protein
MSAGSSWHEAIKQFRKLGIITDSDISSAPDNFALAQKILEKAKGKQINFVERRLGRALRPNWFPESLA